MSAILVFVTVLMLVVYIVLIEHLIRIGWTWPRFLIYTAGVFLYIIFLYVVWIRLTGRVI